ncbi:MAG: lysophospholipid acyltransferase family protein [Acidimicrobiales bacterium]
MVETTPDLGGGSPRLYRAVRIVAMFLFKVMFRLEVVGEEHVPTEGGFVLAPGAHRSILDTPLAAATTPRILRYMGAEKYFATPGLGRFLLAVGGFPVERHMADREALRLSELILAAGDPLVIFPESTRYQGPVVAPIKEGAAFLACRAGVPIVPVGIGGAERALPIGGRIIRPRKCTIVIGKPIMPPERVAGERVKRSTVKAISQQLHDSLQELFDQAQIRAGL